MAKKTEQAATEQKTEEKKALSVTEKKALFHEYEKNQTEVEKAQKLLATAMGARSESVRRIFEGCGAGPFNFKGALLTVAKRAVKDEEDKPTGESTYYFRRQGGEVEVI